MNIKESYTFDDLLLVPKYSTVTSRSDVNLSVRINQGNESYMFNTPIVPANMASISGLEMARFMIEQNGLAIVHRFQSIEDQLSILDSLKNIGALYVPCDHVAFSVGVQRADKNNLEKLVAAGLKIVCIDIAHCDSKLGIDMCRYIKATYKDMLIIAGNVATGDAAVRLWEAGATIVKSSVGGGSLCTTRIETGCGVPTLSAIMDLAEAKKTYNLTSPERYVYIMADGGIRNAGDCCKSLCFADMVMCGNIFAGTDEAPGEIVTINEKQYKRYNGSSTHKSNHIEGVTALMPLKGPAQKVLNKLHEGLRSGCAYQNAHDLKWLKKDPQFIKVSQAGLAESKPHDIIQTS